MKPNRRKMSFDEHTQLGNTIKSLQHQLFDVIDYFGVSSKEGRLLWQFLSADGCLSKLQCLLDDVVCRDYPDGAPEKVYYGNIIIDAPQYSLYNVQYDTR